jgi:positive regulator of sigma E activity
MSAFVLYVFGFIVFVAGVLYAEYLMHVPQTWVFVTALVLIGMGVMSAVSHTKRRDPPSESPSP